MPRRIPAAGCMVNSFSTNFTNQSKGIWISDALLADTFHNFCRTSRRYGSHVPGPLEARRRASKRKNTSLAHGGNAQAVFDPAVMLGSGSSEHWWKNTREPRAQSGPTSSTTRSQEQDQDLQTPSLLPAWLFNAPDPPQSLAVASEEAGGLGAEKFPELEHTIKRSLKRAVDLDSVRNTIKTMQIDLRQHPELCHFVFDRLIQIYGQAEKYSRVAPALYDPVLNPPGSSNQLLLLRHLCSNHMSRKSWDSSIFPALLKAVELGLVSVQDIQEIILLIPKIHETIPTKRLDYKVYAEWHRLLTAVEQSRILRIDDFDPQFLSSWYAIINEGAYTDTTCILLWRLRQYSALSELDLASNLTVRRLHHLVQVNEEASTKMVGWLAALPLSLQGPVIIRSTFRMLSSARKEDDLVAYDALERWSEILPRLCSSDRGQDFPIDQSSWSQASSAPCDLTAPQQLLSVIWVATRLWASRPNTTARFQNLGIRDQFEQTFTNMAAADQFDHVGRVVLVLDTLPLPHKDKIFRYLQSFSNQNLIKMLGHKKYQSDLQACFRLEYAKLQDNAFAVRGRRHFPQVLTALSESINNDLQQFKAMSQTLILKGNDYFRIVSRLLEYNMELRFALAKAWPRALADRNVKEADSHLHPALVLAMVEQLVMTFAVTPVISPRSAFRHVYKMYLFLHKVGAPINPVIARALWHTGVTRYGQAGASKTQINWCMSKVREIEGREVANRLLWSAGFRRTFLCDFTHLLTKENGPMKLPEDLVRAEQEDPDTGEPVEHQHRSGQ